MVIGKCKAIGVSNYTVDHLKQMETYLFLFFIILE